MNAIIKPIQVDVVRLDASATHDDVAAALVWLGRLKEIVKEADAAIEEDAKLWIEANGPVRIGSITYFVGPEKKSPKCTDLPGAIDALLNKLGGDFDALCKHLSSGALKYGAFRETAPEMFDQYFKVETVQSLKSGESATVEKKLRKFDERFIK